ncbi:MAG: phytanoyl-CoA dioxygenase [Rickettsiales bacterium]|jgi:non-heme Fe2+,alpha-ketoglutarate-dependent halogenase|nr:phytanoyl-CoA dioxygenase [Rickettsiales bacterium]
MIMTIKLTDEQVDAYHRDGVVYPISVMSREEARKCRSALETFECAHPEYLDGGRRQKLHLVQTWMADVVRRPEILDAVEDILGPDILCWQTSLFIKEAGDPGFVSWHQDGNYWGLSSQEVVTAWLALSPSSVESGCMKMMPGSHRWASIEHKDTFDKDNLLTRGQVMKHDIDEDQAIDIIVEPGEISLHHVNIAHASAPNRSDDRRIGLALRYVTPSVRQVTGVPDAATLVRGKDKNGNFEMEPAPEYDMAPAAVALHERVTDTRKGFIYQDKMQHNN